MQFRTLIATGTVLAALASATVAQAFPHTDDMALHAAVNHDTALAATHRPEHGAFDEADQLLKSVGEHGLSGGPDTATILRSTVELSVAAVTTRRPQAWVPASTTGYATLWDSTLQVRSISRVDVPAWHKTRAFDRTASGPYRVMTAEPVRDEGPAGIVGSQESVLLAMLKSVVGAVQAGVGGTVSLLRDLGRGNPTAV